MSSKAEARAAIYERLSAAPTFYPASAELFSDWTLQGGDVITVHSDNENYTFPIYGMSIRWNGSTKVNVQSTGNENRGSLEAMAEKQLTRSRGGYRSAVRTDTQMQGLYYDFYSDDGFFHTTIQATASAIRTEVGATISGMAHSVIEQTASYIRTTVEGAASAISRSVIEQTKDYVRTEVASVASGVAWSVVEQTMTGIFQEVARKSKTYRQWTDPNDGINELHDGDIWIKTKTDKTWNDLSTKTWNEVGESNTWSDLYGSMTYVWREKDGVGSWQLVEDGIATVESRTWVEQNNERYAILAHQVDTQGQAFDSNLTVTAQKISTDVTAAKGELRSAIAQTATSITMHVENVKQGLQSSITQTAESITLSVSASKSQLYSTIEQTATQIRMEVANSISDVRSTITQTAESITLSVSASKSELYSTIQQTATQIRAEVANSISDVRSTITQTADSINLSVDTAKSAIWSSITQTSTQISLKVGKGDVISSINQTAESITISASKVNLNGYVKATDITAQYISSVLNNTSVLSTNYLFSKSMEVGTGTFTINGYACALEDGIHSLQITSSGNTYTLQGKHFTSSDWYTIGSFSRAVNSASWEWVSGYPKVTLSPQGQSFNGTGLTLNGITYRNRTWASDKKSFDAEFYVYDSSSNEPYKETLTIGTTDSWNAGSASGAASVTVSSVAAPTNRTNDSFTVTGTASNGATRQRSYYLVQSGIYMYVCQGGRTIGTNYTVARIPIDFD